ncbi:MAG: methylmalonyl Co-A mutase-associated GTPase MeaB [Flavobacteriales bacterium]|nr:methylmalonyl Co-A mutase-associated GTPase MeaB [Flavobacteriales bacterium]
MKLTSKDYIKGILGRDIGILSKAITLIESEREEHQLLAREILAECIKVKSTTIRVGITGVPGAGKSTFIEALGTYLVKEKGAKIAVLAIDPSSKRTKGSILGDKTRMSNLSTMKEVYIRPTASSGMLGGVAKATRETLILCEAAGFEIILIETVGVGQSEIEVKDMVDFFLLLAIAGAGDELQGIKRGIMEMVDAIVVNKADGVNVGNAEKTVRDIKNALHLFPLGDSAWKPQVTTCSSIENKGIETVWEIIESHATLTRSNGYFQENRKKQDVQAFQNFLRKKILQFFLGNEKTTEMINQYEKRIADNTENPYTAAYKIFKRIVKE